MSILKSEAEAAASSMPSTPWSFYRFRSTEALLGRFQELEKQEIYLASPQELNDPVEGYKDVFWLGDVVLWRNLFRHYLLNLVQAIMYLHVMPNDQWEEPKLDAFLTLDDLPTPMLREMVVKVSESFFAEPSVEAALTALAELKRPLGPAAVSFCLLTVHARAVHEAFTVLFSYGFSREGSPVPPSAMNEQGLQEILALLRADNAEIDEAHLEHMWSASQGVHEQMNFIHRYNARSNEGFQKVAYLMTEFPSRYVAQIIEALIHPPWFTACFTENCTNASMWGSYGAGHTGVALKFRATPLSAGCPAIDLEGITGWSQVESGPPVPISGRMTFPLQKVSYGAEPPAVDFFRFLGRLPWGRYLKTWLSDDLGRHSERLRGAFDDQKQWRDQLWGLFNSGATRKLPDWEFEREYRIVDADLIGTRTKHRHVRYPFEALAGIVFGLRTKFEDKMRITEIVERKCRESGREDFEFAQAHYSRTKQQIEIVPMGLLRFKR